jgi:hypothetical protein
MKVALELDYCARGRRLLDAAFRVEGEARRQRRPELGVGPAVAGGLATRIVSSRPAELRNRCVYL